LQLSSHSPRSAVPAGVKYKTFGIYVDAGGGQHPWSINEAHTLAWDGQPHVPVGGLFASRCIALGASDENYQADVKTLDLIKSKGITDIVLKGEGPASLTDPAAWQRIIDYLDSHGFTYGIELDDGPKEPLKGYLISPSRYRLEGPYPETKVACNWPDVDSAIYVVATRIDNSIKATGGAVVKDGRVTVNLSAPLGSGDTLIVYPRKAYKGIAEGGVADIWTGFGEYRDRLIAFLKKIKLGPGMRFFIEPFTSKMDFTGEMIGLLPDSQGFRVGLEAYLTKRYVHEGAVNAAWGLNENLSSIEVAARLMPLWSMGRGVTSAYDRASAKLYSIDAGVSRIWRDIVEYRDTSVQEYMNAIADTLRRQVANVPVIFKCSKYHRIYQNPYGMGGYDGLGVAADGVGDAPVVNTAGPAYSLAEESAKSTWFIVAATRASADCFPNEAALLATLDSFREIGCKGFFVDGLVNKPEQLDWLAGFKKKAAAASIAGFTPNVIGYPLTPTTGAYVKRLARDTWWLPTLRIGATTYIGDGMCAYALVGEDKAYMWSSIGPKTITLKAGPTGFPSVEFPGNAPISKKKNGQFSVTLTDVPTVLRGLDITLAFPYETATTEIDRLASAIVEADKAGLSVKNARAAVESARRVLKNNSPLTAFGMAQQSLQELLAGAGADVWIEGEQSQANSFDGIYPMPGASNNLVLLLDTDEEPPLSPYTASFSFDALSNSSYEIWLAATPPSDGSKMSYNVEDTGWVPVTIVGEQRAESTEPEPGSRERRAESREPRKYAPGLAWYRMGSANLMPGRHTIKFRADARAPFPPHIPPGIDTWRDGIDTWRDRGRYYFAIDALVLSPRGFKPNGVIKPF